MLKQVTKSLLVMMAVVYPVFADETLSSFHQQADINYPEPIAEESYFATKAPMESGLFRYFGINLGAGVIPIKTEITMNNITNTQNRNSGIYNFGAYGGFGGNFQHLYLGAELGVRYNLLNKTVNASLNGDNMQLTVKEPVSGYIDFMPGYLNGTKSLLFYGRLGMGVSLFKLNFSETAANITGNSNKINLGLRAGVGVEFFINDIFSIRPEYLYQSNNNANDSANGINYKLKSGGTNQINLGLSFHF